MSLPAGQQRVLTRIEGDLEGSDPRLTSLFVIFGRLVQGEAMPRDEHIRVRPVADRAAAAIAFLRRLVRPAARVRMVIVLPTALAAMICAVTMAAVFQAAPRGAPARARMANELMVRPGGCRFTVLRAPARGC